MWNYSSDYSLSCWNVPNFCLSPLRTQASSVCDGEEQEDFLGELTLHPDPLTPEGVLCTPANAVEVHRDSQPGEENLSLVYIHSRVY